MRNPLNKAFSPEIKEPAAMNPELKRIMNKAEALSQAAPQNREDFLRGIAQAQEAQAHAAEAKETAENEADFDKACDDEVRAREKEAFFRRLLEKMDYSPRMSEEEYQADVKTVDAVVTEAADDFRQIARRAVTEIVRAREKYLRIISDADKTLDALDKSSRVLQVKYRYRKTEFTDGSSFLTEDPDEWHRHMIRYMPGKGHDLACKDPNSKNPYDPWDDIICAAWAAAERITER